MSEGLQGVRPNAETLGSVSKEIRELAERSVEHGTPLFLLVHYRHEAEKAELIRRLEEALQDSGLCARIFDPRRRPEEEGAGKLYGALIELDERTIGLVISMPRGEHFGEVDRDFLAYINLHRDRIPRQTLRWMLFVHESEEEQVQEHAGDLWGFQQHDFWLKRSPDSWGEWGGKYQPGFSMLLAPRGLDDKPRMGKRDLGEAEGRIRELLAKSSHPEDQARLYYQLADHFYLTGRDEGGLDAASQGLEVLPPDGSAELRAQLLTVQGELLFRQKKYDSAIDSFKQAYEIWASLRKEVERANILIYLAWILERQGEHAKALSILHKQLRGKPEYISLESRQFSEDSLEYRRLRTALAALHLRQGDLEKAAGVLEGQVSIDQRAGGILFMFAETRFNLGSIYSVLGDQEKAESHLRKAIEGWHQEMPGMEASALTELARVRLRQHDYVQALDLLEESLELCFSIENSLGVAINLLHIAQIQAAWGRYDEAEETLEEALEAARIGHHLEAQEQILAQLQRIQPYERREPGLSEVAERTPKRSWHER